MKKRQKGSYHREATLFLPLFFLAFVSIYSLISFTRAQLIVQYAADQAAKRSGTVQLYSGKDRNSGFFGRTEFQVRGF